MTSKNNLHEMLPPEQLAKWMVEHSYLWQMRILDQNGLAWFGRDRGSSFSFGNEIAELWQIGLLKADYIESETQLNIEGLKLIVQTDHGMYYYADCRSSTFPGGLSDTLVPFEREGVRLYFHPFRFYVLNYINEFLKPNIHVKQQLQRATGYSEVLEWWQKWFDKFTASSNFASQLQAREDVARLAIAIEPCHYQKLFGVVKYSWPIDETTFEDELESHCLAVYEVVTHLGVDSLEELRTSLCIDAERLDPNKDVHTILRLTSGEQRVTKVKGRLGGSMCLLTMAELIRRATETVFGVELPEEDEKGFGLTLAGFKQQIYGSNRVIDNRSARSEYLRNHGLDHGLRIRWYVEGVTEYDALNAVLGNLHQIELVNLRGRVAQGGDKGVSFRDSLRNDIKAQIFSFVSLDKDNGDYYRAIQKAMYDDEIQGMVFISDPDFEFENFTRDELEEILWQIAEEAGASKELRLDLHRAVTNANSARELLNRARRVLPELSGVGKGGLGENDSWGLRLMRWSSKTPKRLDAKGELKQRQIDYAIECALRGLKVNYQLTHVRYRINPQTGMPVERETDIVNKT